MESKSQIIIYTTEKSETKLEVRLESETVWLTQKLMAELFQTTSQNITIHLKNIFEEGELSEWATCKDFLQVGKEGERMVERNQKITDIYATSADYDPTYDASILFFQTVQNKCIGLKTFFIFR